LVKYVIMPNKKLTMGIVTLASVFLMLLATQKTFSSLTEDAIQLGAPKQQLKNNQLLVNTLLTLISIFITINFIFNVCIDRREDSQRNNAPPLFNVAALQNHGSIDSDAESEDFDPRDNNLVHRRPDSPN